MYLIYGARDGAMLDAIFTSKTGIINLPEVDAAFGAALEIVDPAERAEAYGEATKLLLSTGRAVPVCADKTFFGVSSRLKNVKISNTGVLMLQDAYFE